MKSQSWFRLGVLFICGFISIFASSGTQSGGSQHTQDRVSKEVYHELVMLPQLTIFDNIAYRIDGGKVTLLGQVREAILKDAAQGAVKKIEGVDVVDNQIEILPPSPNDDRIRHEVTRAIFNDDALFPYSMGSVPSIHIIVKGGHVTLEGAVNNQGDKDRVGIKANGVSGIFEVKNNLQVHTN
ncbi:MAG TPA: BON domain-containing protein [Candidatus Angelobacter sp.]